MITTMSHYYSRIIEVNQYYRIIIIFYLWTTYTEIEYVRLTEEQKLFYAYVASFNAVNFPCNAFLLLFVSKDVSWLSI